MNLKLAVVALVVMCAGFAQSFTLQKLYPHYPPLPPYGLGLGLNPLLDGCGCPPDPCAPPPCAPPPCAPLPLAPPLLDPCADPCGYDALGKKIVAVSPVVGLLSKLKAKFIAKLTDEFGCGCGCGCAKKCAWLNSPSLYDTCRACNKYC